MDCEKFEPLLLDELYEELDELTSAALKRHVSGCARCSAALNGMRATRRLATFPIVDVPEGLEDKIFAATREAQKVVPIRSRASRALSWAGSWAMRPQTAMAAVFLLMIGSSAFLLRAKRDAARESEVSVTVRGEPAGALAAADHDSLDDKAAAAAHGAAVPPPVAPMAAAAPAATALTLADPMDRATAGAGRGKDEASLGALAASAPAKEEEGDFAGNAQKKGFARSLEPSNAAAPAGAPAQLADSMQQRVAPSPVATTGSSVQDGYSAGMAAYRARNYAEAIRLFDGAAQTGDQNSALWAARSVNDSHGCAAALPRFEAVAQKAAGSYTGSDALYEAGRCQLTLGQIDGAREKFTRLTTVASHEARARQALANLDQVAARREAERSKAGTPGAGGMAAPKAAAPAPAKPASKPTDTANSF
ncbi:very large tegument protein [Labilithrix luteola]|uniref:Very large tegument protein n=1 Tax=Labilithrix luteola TaxID=1391654 RepID=A0A0K1Q7V0_9BACT|nr:hypothetical protein [Labilithrix luteola]AKV01722.1 very large tegument protein [Labilithrix luteola]